MNMKKEELIIVFTKNRPKKLSKTLPRIVSINLPVIVLDDSTNLESKKVVKDISKNSRNVHYHGEIEQRKVLWKFPKKNELKSFVSPLGSDGWTLGYARNYAIILAKIFGFKRVLFMDDDIIVGDANLILRMFGMLNNADFVGAEIKGMPDFSVVDFVMQEIGIEPYRFMSGGFLAFNLDSVYEYFLNYYNEDWIWLFLHEPKARVVKYGEVHQLPYDPFENAVERALQQEFGEILVKGVMEAEIKNDFTLLKNNISWRKILKKRKDNLREIKEMCKNKKFEIGVDVCSALLEYHRHLSPDNFVGIFKQYFSKKISWLDLIRNGGIGYA